MTNMKNAVYLAGMIILVSAGCSASNDAVDKANLRNSLYDEARILIRSGKIEEAINKYLESNQPQYISYEYEKQFGRGMACKLSESIGKYDEALKYAKETLELYPKVDTNQLQVEEIESLLEYSRSGDDGLVRNHIQTLRNRYREYLPPAQYSVNYVWVIADILRMFDTIGAHDEAISFIDMILNYTRSKEAPDYKPGHNYQEYLKVREAFEKDKAAGTKGSATKALLKSDYFPW